MGRGWSAACLPMLLVTVLKPVLHNLELRSIFAVCEFTKSNLCFIVGSSTQVLGEKLARVLLRRVEVNDLLGLRNIDSPLPLKPFIRSVDPALSNMMLVSLVTLSRWHDLQSRPQSGQFGALASSSETSYILLNAKFQIPSRSS